MKKILCPTDFSDASRNAIVYAAKLARTIGASITLFNVQSTLRSVDAFFKEEKEMIMSTVQDQLNELSNEVYKSFKVPCHPELTDSPNVLSSVIAKKANEYDLTVMGTNGADDLWELFSGSNTYRTVQQTKIPLLLVPASVSYSEINKMVYAYDYLKTRKLPLQQLKFWGELLKCELVILQVIEEAVSQKVNEEIEALQGVLNQQRSNEDIKLHFETVRSSEIPSGINSYMNRTESDILVLSTIHRGVLSNLFHKSVTKIISNIADYPVLVLHE